MRAAPASRRESHRGLSKGHFFGYFLRMSTVREIEDAIPRLTRAEVEALRDWIDDFLEDDLPISTEVAAKMEQSRKEIAAGQFTTRQPDQ